MKKRLILSLAILAVILALSITVAAGAVLYETDFTTVLGAWKEIVGEGGSSISSIMNLENGTRTILKDVAFKNGTIEARVLADEIYDQDHWIGILFGMQQPEYKNGMMAFFRGPRFTLKERIFVIDWAKGVVLQKEPTAEMKLFEGWFNLKVVVDGKKINLFVNDVPAGEAEMPEAYLNGGQVGIAVNALRGQVASFKVTAK